MYQVSEQLLVVIIVPLILPRLLFGETFVPGVCVRVYVESRCEMNFSLWFAVKSERNRI